METVILNGRYDTFSKRWLEAEPQAGHLFNLIAARTPCVPHLALADHF